jgi:hypothetical protein
MSDFFDLSTLPDKALLPTLLAIWWQWWQGPLEEQQDMETGLLQKILSLDVLSWNKQRQGFWGIGPYTIAGCFRFLTQHQDRVPPEILRAFAQKVIMDTEEGWPEENVLMDLSIDVGTYRLAEHYLQINPGQKELSPESGRTR